MNNELQQNVANDPASAQPEQQSSNYPTLDRRKFVGVMASAALTFSIVPRHVLGKGFIAPSDKITLAYIGTGTEGIREMLPLLGVEGFQVVAVCDPNQYAIGYRDWSPEGLKNDIRTAIKKSDWNPGGDNKIPGGRENGKNIVETFYANVRPERKYKGCAAYADFRELLDKEKDLDSVKIMTPDHLHGVISIAAMKKGKHVLMHKPVSNRLLEGKRVIDTARNTKVITHLMPWDANGSMDQVMAWINSGEIGTLKEVHNWTNRPVWPQYPTLPTDSPAIPKGFNWDLWLGPESLRPYHPNYTNMVFRGWYDFGGGSMADMGHYSLWTVFNALQLESPTIVEPCLSHFVDMHDVVPFQVRNDFSFPMASTVRFYYPAKGSRPSVELVWYDGGMRPSIPVELMQENKELPREGMMFVGDKGKILTGFNIENPQLITGNKLQPSTPGKPQGDSNQSEEALQQFVDACKSGKQYPGNFIEAEYLTEAINLYAVALRSGRLLKYDPNSRTITNATETNKYLSREYRQGWDPAVI